MELGSDRTKAFGQHDICAPMEQAHRLSVSFNWHRCNESRRRCLKNLNAHLLIEGSAAARTQLRHEIGIFFFAHEEEVYLE